MKNDLWVAYHERCDGEKVVSDVRDDWEFEDVERGGAKNPQPNRRTQRTPPAEGGMAVDLEQAASMLNVSVKTIRREIDRGKLHCLRIGRVLRIRVAEVQAYLERCQRPS